MELPADGDFSPPKPTQRRPFAAPAAITPLDDIAREVINGGDSEMLASPEAGAWADSVLYRIRLQRRRSGLVR